jgi:hypothetical protein
MWVDPGLCGSFALSWRFKLLLASKGALKSTPESIIPTVQFAPHAELATVALALLIAAAMFLSLRSITELGLTR